MAVTVSPVSCVIRIRLNNGTSASGLPVLKNVSLFSSSKLKPSLDNTALEGVMAIIEALESCFDKTINSVVYVPTSTLITA